MAVVGGGARGGDAPNAGGGGAVQYADIGVSVGGGTAPRTPGDGGGDVANAATGSSSVCRGGDGGGGGGAGARSAAGASGASTKCTYPFPVFTSPRTTTAASARVARAVSAHDSYTPRADAASSGDVANVLVSSLGGDAPCDAESSSAGSSTAESSSAFSFDLSNARASASVALASRWFARRWSPASIGNHRFGSSDTARKGDGAQSSLTPGSAAHRVSFVGDAGAF